MALTSFIPEVWSARLLENLRKQLVFASLCNRSWEGEIHAYGDTVHINTVTDVTVRPYTPGADIAAPERLGGTDQTLVIDHAAYCNFYLNDVEAAQVRPDVLDAATRSAAAGLAEDTEAYVLSVILAGATQLDYSARVSDVYEKIVDLKAELDGNNMPRAGRCLVMPPTVEAELLKDSRFVTAGTASGAAALADGAIARAAGFDIFISNDLTDRVVAMTSDAVTFAQQILSVEAYRREQGFDTGVKALSVCGAKVVRPDCVAACRL